jgi:hypothetical protein
MNHTNLMDLELVNPRRPGKAIYVETKVLGGKLFFIFERMRWDDTTQDNVSESTHQIAPADFTKRWRVLERAGWRVSVPKKAPEVVRGRYVAPSHCDCHPLPKTVGKPLKL